MSSFAGRLDAPLHALSEMLASARAARTRLDAPAPDLVPADADAAYAIQHETLWLADARIGGWKVGAKSPVAAVQGAPLPAAGIHASGARLTRSEYVPAGLELEIAFRFARRFEPSNEPYSDAEVLAGIDGIAAAVEIVASRYTGWPEIDRLAQLADLQNHGALIVGEFTRYRADFPFVAPALQLHFEGRDVLHSAPSNPAGDPRRLLPWLVNHCTRKLRIAVTPEWVITTGSYTGMFFPETAGELSGRIDGLAPVNLALR